MYCPSVDEIKQLRHAEYNTRVDKRRPLVPLYRDILTDLETPVSAYCKTARGPYSFLLESVTGGERVGRYSFIGIEPYMVIVHDGDTVTRYKMGSVDKQNKQGRESGRNREGVESGRKRESVESGRNELRPYSEEVFCYDPLRLIEEELGQYQLMPMPGASQDELPRFHGGAVGYLAYEA